MFLSRVISDGIELIGSGRYQFIIELQQENDPAWVQVASLPVLVSYQPAAPPPIR